MIDFTRLLSLPYWITRNPNPISQDFLYGWLVLAIAVFVVGFAVRVWSSRNRDLATQWVSWYYRISRLLITVSLSSLLLLLFRYERIPLFAARWWMLVLVVWAVVWGVSILQQRARVHAAIEKREVVQRLQRFIPKRKK